MKNKVMIFSRIFLGLIYFVFGLNGFLQFLPQPPLPDAAMSFFGALISTGYFLPLLKGTEVLGGLLLLLNVGAPVALVILAPISVQIFFFHAYLTPGLENLVMPIAILGLHGVAALKHLHLYMPLFARRGLLE